MSAPTRNVNLKLPDKIVAILLGLIGLGIMTVVGLMVLPYVIAAMTNMFIFLGMLAALIFIPWSIYDNRETIKLWYFNKCRAIRRSIIADDPIGTLVSIITRFQKKLDEIKQHLVEAAAAKKRHENDVKDWQRKVSENKRLGDASNSQATRELYYVKAKRWDDAVQAALPQLEVLAKMHEKMELAKNMAATRIDDLENQKEVLQATLDNMKSSQSAVRKFKAFFGSSAELRDLQDTVEIIEIQSTEAEAEIDGFLNDISPLLQADDLRKKADAIAAMERFGATPKALPESNVIEGTFVKEKEKVR